MSPLNNKSVEHSGEQVKLKKKKKKMRQEKRINSAIVLKKIFNTLWDKETIQFSSVCF